MVKVEFLGPIGKASQEYDVDSLAALSVILQADEEVAPWLQNSAVAINDTLVSSLEAALKDGDKVSLLPPVCGG